MDFVADMAKHLSSAHCSIFVNGQKDLSHLINVGVGTGNSEVTSIGVGEKVVGLRKCGSKEVE